MSVHVIGDTSGSSEPSIHLYDAYNNYATLTWILSSRLSGYPLLGRRSPPSDAASGAELK